MTSDDLNHCRELWYQAYFDGDSERLTFFESEDFCVISPRGPHFQTQTRTQQLQSISQARRAGQWFAHGGSKTDQSLSIELQGLRAEVRGRGYVCDGDERGPISQFTEQWRFEQGRWRVVQLKYQLPGDL